MILPVLESLAQGSPSFTSGLGAATRRGVQNEGPAVLGIRGACRFVHALPGRGHQKPREVAADKSRTARLPRGNAQRAQASAVRIVDVDTAAAPARVPDQSVRIDTAPIEPADTRAMNEDRGLARGSPVEASSGTRCMMLVAVSAK